MPDQPWRRAAGRGETGQHRDSTSIALQTWTSPKPATIAGQPAPTTSQGISPTGKPPLPPSLSRAPYARHIPESVRLVEWSQIAGTDLFSYEDAALRAYHDMRSAFRINLQRACPETY